MLCSLCGRENTLGQVQCAACTRALEPRCLACGASHATGANYCSHCGQPLGGAAIPAHALHSAPLPAPLRERTRARTVLSGERRQVTVLFADIRGSLRAIEGGDPEEAQALLDAVLAAMIAEVHRYEGTVNQVLGDGIMALFGAPVTHEDHAVRAARAALAMQQAVAKLQDPAWVERSMVPQIRVGLNSGEVLIQTVRNDLSMEYRAVGSTTHMAARMEQLATPGSVRLTAQTLELGRGLLRTRRLGAIAVKGASEPVDVFELLGVSARTRFAASENRVLSELVGRRELLDELASALRDAVAGRPRAAMLAGEPGVGKSRLCYELLQLPQAAGCRVLEATALSYGMAVSYGVLGNLLRSLLEVEDGDAPSAVAGRAAELARQRDLACQDVEAVALELIGAPVEDAAWLRLEPVQRRRRIEEVVRALIRGACEDGPTVLLFEDLHWCDAPSASVIEQLLQAPPADRVLLLGTHRNEWQPGFRQAPHLRAYRLDTLSPPAAERMLAGLLGDGEALAPLRRRLAMRTGGNPFFLEESARALIERGLLEAHGAGVGAALDVDAALLEVPATVEALIAARLSRLSPEALEVLQATAVIGDEAPIELLRRVTDLSEGELERRLALLAATELVYHVGERHLCRLRHALIRDVAYRQLLRSRRRALHARVVAAIEQLYTLRIAEHVERLAEHSLRAELWEKSTRYHQLASVRAASRWANLQAMAHIERGLESVAHLPPGPLRHRAAVDLRLLALAPLLPQGDHERMLAMLREAEPHAQALGDERRIATLASQLATGLWMTARHDEAMEVAERVVTRAQALGDADFVGAARYNVAMIHHARGELDRAMAVLRVLLERYSGEQARRRPVHWSGYPMVFVRTFAVSALTLLGEFEEAEQLFVEGEEVARELDHPHSRTMILEEYGFCLLVKGEPRAATGVLRQAMEVCLRNEVRVMHAPIAARLGAALSQSGRVDEALELLQDALARKIYRAAAHYGLDYLLVALAEASLRAGDLAAALEHAARAERVALDAGEHAYHVCALVQLGEVLGARGDATAAGVLQRALEKAQRLRMRPWQAFALQARGGLALRAGRRVEAEEDFDAAARIWRLLGAPARLAQLELSRAPDAGRRTPADDKRSEV